MGMVQPKDRSTVPCNAPCTANRQELTAGGKKSIFPQQTRLSLMFWSSSSAEAVTVCQRGWRWGILHPSPNTARKRICQKPTVPSTKQAAGRVLLSRIKRKIVRKLKIPYFLSYLNSSILALTLQANVQACIEAKMSSIQKYLSPKNSFLEPFFTLY